ncbi:MAG: peptidylprolyl isomerase [Alicyclobacillus macrosporangiidus]|uniref:peptidyl-prolyl cis-trans isomerase n=1 Tax=Alicyclobacillus macrosporangiidus TaxID=392015 RepID=UPI0026F23CAE|nr:peptidyl-prolyl cis-trans isomerase [Alicyclobacillus macrosporangiidus]MCL6599330.1 peptidylprolyl isomerase [Alicyclobacillus macrosporangiidus]
MRNKRMHALAAFLLGVALVAGCGGPGQAANQTGNAAGTQNATAAAPIPPEPAYTGPVVATYTGGEVRKDELDRQYNLQVVLPGLQQQESKKDFLTYYVVWYKYLYGKAQQLTNVKTDPAQARQLADQAIQELVGSQYKSQDEVKQKMQSLGVSEDDLARLALKSQYLQQYLLDQTKDLQVTDQQAQTYYNQHKDDYLQVTVHHILVSSLDQAKQIEAQLKQGADFEKLADQYSTDPAVKDNHGQYADQPVSSFDADFAKAVKTLPIGQISDPVHTQYGYHIIRVDKRTQIPFDQAKDEIKQTLLTQAQNDKEKAIYADAQKAAHIQLKVAEKDL